MKSKILLMAASAILFTASCTKDIDESIQGTKATTSNGSNSPTTLGKSAQRSTRAYQEVFEATSTITPTNTGIYNPGGGNGNATHFGNAMMRFNQIVNFFNGQPIGSSAASVNQFYATELAAAGISNIPSNVSSITYDKDGNAVWFTSTTGNTLVPVSATQVNFYASLSIIGVTGKFEGASGSVQMTGSFNPQSANQIASIKTTGNITY